MYGEYFRAKGCVVYTAADGRVGIDKAIELKPDAVVLDLAMPKVDGWTVLKSIRASSWTAPIRIVVVTALQSVRDEALRAGADACLLKPCAPDVLWLQVRALVSARAAVASVGRVL